MKGAIACLVLGVLACVHAQDTKPWFCHDLDCPEYKLLKNLSDIDVEYRSYQKGESPTPTAAAAAKFAVHGVVFANNYCDVDVASMLLL